MSALSTAQRNESDDGMTKSTNIPTINNSGTKLNGSNSVKLLYFSIITVVLSLAYDYFLPAMLIK